MNLFLKRLALAASYLTSIPGLKRAEKQEDLEGLVGFLPLIGLAIGGIMALACQALLLLDANSVLQAFLLVVLWIVLTGGLHLDGLMDTADGIFSGRGRERMLEVMRDSRVGNFGAIAGMVVLLGKTIGLALVPQQILIPLLLLIPAWARFAEASTIVSYPYARDEGQGKIWRDSNSHSDLIPASIAPFLVLVLFCWQLHSLLPVVILPAVLIPASMFSHAVADRLGGQTGDTYGAVVEFSETAALLILALISV